MTLPTLRYAGGRYDRTAALERGEIGVDGVELAYVAYANPGELFREMAQDAPYAASEMSLSTYLMLLAGGDRRLIGIPVFPSRAFRHSQIYVHRESGIEHPRDLAGRLVGVPDYQMTAAVWLRGALEDDHGLSPTEPRWRVGGLKRPGWRRRLAFSTPPGVELEPIAADQSLEAMLAGGELDALVTTDAPDAFRAGGPVRRLFEDYRAVESDYYARTRCFPIMHLVVLRRDVYESSPALALALARALDEAKAAALTRLGRFGTLAVMHPWIGDELERLWDAFGGDPFAYGWEANRHVVQRLVDHSRRQGLIDRGFAAEELFAPETLAWRPAPAPRP